MYCYSTYKFSPVGYAIGSVEVPVTANLRYVELKPCRDGFVRNCFEQDLIKRVLGKSPVTGHYYFMVKDLRCEFINEDNVQSHKNGNFLFEFDNIEEYTRFVKNYDKSRLETAMNGFIVPDSFAKTFALKLDTEKLNDYINSALSSEPRSERNVACENLCFETTSGESGIEEGLSEIAGCPISKEKDMIYSSKKNTRSSRWVIPAIAVLVLAAVAAAIFLLVRKIHQ